jgi:3-carboxy-cis,cis-muconate cycloisomerase
VLREFAAELGVGEPTLPWHAHRGRFATFGSHLAIVAGVLGKIALDVELLAQTEAGEVESGSGESSSMPHKRNPVEAIRVRACARRVQAAAGLLVGGVAEHEHERAAGAWHAEWTPLGEALACTGGAAAAAREMLDGLVVRPERMRENMGQVDPSPHVAAAGALVDRALGRYRG